jgi:hypothetical protein
MSRANWVHGMLQEVVPKGDSDKSLEDRKLPWFIRVYRLTDKAKEWVAQERPKIEAWLAEKATEDAKVTRLVIIKEWHRRWDSIHFGVPKHVAGLFRVTSETEKRLYGELVEHPDTDRLFSTYNIVHGGGRSKMYIDREQIVVDNATPEMYQRMLKVDTEWMVELDAQEKTFKQEVAELEARYKRARIQGAAMYSDLFREAGAPKEAVDKIMDEVRGPPEEKDEDE